MRSRLRWGIAIALLLVLGGGMVYAWYRWHWRQILTCEAPDRSRRSVVWEYFAWAPFGGRHDYYLIFEPAIDFRLIDVDESHMTLKSSFSTAFPNEKRPAAWKTWHYLGYLQGFDSVPNRQPNQVVWDGDRVRLLSKQGIAAAVELR